MENTVTLQELFRGGSIIDVSGFANKWLVDYPLIYRDVPIEIVSNVSELLKPKYLEQIIFPGRILLRKSTLTRWNQLVKAMLNPSSGRVNIQIASSAGGLGKSIELYLFAIFGLYLGWIVQYFGRTNVLCQKYPDEGAMAKLYLCMIKYLNKGRLEHFGWKYPSEKFVEGVNIQGMTLLDLVNLGITKKSMTLAETVRTAFKMANVKKEYTSTIIATPLHELCHFLGYYSRMLNLPMAPCGVVLAGSQHHTFEDSLTSSGVLRYLRYIEPLSDEEFAEFERQPEYPALLTENRETVISYTGKVPRQIQDLIDLSRKYSSYDFKKLIEIYVAKFVSEASPKYLNYIESLNDRDRESFFEALSALLFPRTNRQNFILKTAYRDKGLVVVHEDETLRFYNLPARDVILDSWLKYAKSKLGNMIDEYRKRTGALKGSLYEKLFFIFCSLSKPTLTGWCPRYQLKYSFSLHSGDLRYFDGTLIDPMIDWMTDELWLYMPSNFARWNFIYYKNLPREEWSIWFFQLSISSFSDHNYGSSRIEHDFEGSECRVSQLLNAIRGIKPGSRGHQVELQVERVDLKIGNSRRKRVASEPSRVVVRDPKGIDCSDRVRFIYVSPYKSPKEVDANLSFIYFIECSPD
ncbi:hypothetical protein GpartN1_g7801.t1 [Galdieria partita]|uniref:Uncharacterized protein n=1 Tax=Galdieria partita TaxID=83374 RepID=A0A9C7Q531_9RHOD|nr:hypothetical protein GpartN1_g7801.t1 [Galdieria partita]